MMKTRALVVPAVLALAWNCGGESSSGEAPVPDASTSLDAGRPDTTTTPPDGGTTPDAAAEAAPDAVATCVADTPCTTNASAPCKQGRIVCTTDVGTCADGPDSDDGTACSTGLCTAGKCLAPSTIAVSTNLSTQSVTAGRTCAAEAPAFAVTALAANSATLSAAPTDDCLVSGDEALLINLQGSSAGTANVGNWELLRVATVVGSTVTFTTNKTRSYGATAGSDTGIGTAATDQKVALYRVPQFGHLTIAGGVTDGGAGDAAATLTASGWNGSIGGVIVLRAAKLTVDGTITAAGLGYRSGRWSQDDSDCDDNLLTESGESFTGPAVAQTANNGGAAGGLSALTNDSFNSNTPVNASAGHAAAGAAGLNPNGRTIGDAGVAYGSNDAGTLTMGSGSAGNLTCEVGGTAGGKLIPAFATTAGGIVVLLAGQLDVGSEGTITASAKTEGRDTSSSAGYVYVKGGTLNVGTNRVTAIGGTAIPGTGGSVGNKSSDGYIVLTGSTKTGTTNPPAN